MKSVLLLSDRSSGSSALQRELLRHPDIRCVASTRHNQMETLYWNKVAAVMDLPLTGMRYSEWPLDRVRARRELVQFLRDNLPGFVLPSNGEELVFEGWRALCRRFGPVFLEKSPHHVHDRSALRMIMEAADRLGDVEFRFVGLIRNPLDTLYSMWHRWRAVPEVAQIDWHRAYSNLLWFRQHAGARMIMLRYEDLVSKPRETMEALCDFLSVEWCPGLGEGLHRMSFGKWKTDHMFGFRPSDEVRALGLRLGYDEADLAVPVRRLWPVYRPLVVATYPAIRRSRRLCRRVVSLLRPGRAGAA